MAIPVLFLRAARPRGGGRFPRAPGSYSITQNYFTLTTFHNPVGAFRGKANYKNETAPVEGALILDMGTGGLGKGKGKGKAYALALVFDRAAPAMCVNNSLYDV